MYFEPILWQSSLPDDLLVECGDSHLALVFLDKKQCSMRLMSPAYHERIDLTGEPSLEKAATRQNHLLRHNGDKRLQSCDHVHH